MDLFLKVVLVTYIIKMAGRLVLLSRQPYPRKIEFFAVDDLITFISNLGLAIWAGTLLFWPVIFSH